MFRMSPLRSERFNLLDLQALEKSSTVENFHNASERARLPSKPGGKASRRRVGIPPQPSRMRRLSVVQKSRPRSYGDQSVVGTGSGRIAVYPKIIPGQKSTSRRSFIDLPEPRFWSHSVLPPRLSLDRLLPACRPTGRYRALRSALGSFSAAQPGSAGRRARGRRRCRVSG
jgi:hypothetical protein